MADKKIIINEDTVTELVNGMIKKSCGRLGSKPEIVKAICESQETKAFILDYCKDFLDQEFYEEDVQVELLRRYAPFMAGYRAAVDYFESQLNK